MPEKGLDVKSLVKKIYAEDKSYCWDRDFTQIGILSNPFLTYISVLATPAYFTYIIR